MAWTSSHEKTTQPCQFGRFKARLKRAQACPYRALVESNSKNANFEGF
ncbi:hypothetical protein F383_33785 [Gossypium arboreum]|uniref:Uncharacterized protein n=1 Tax=Gossypium arboreum TaxID=29729 RepID=A0A0B0PPW7_GOSAR|nr:hypothetical protein F383_33785 [Gossypium arboreum]